MTTRHSESWFVSAPASATATTNYHAAGGHPGGDGLSRSRHRCALFRAVLARGHPERLGRGCLTAQADGVPCLGYIDLNVPRRIGGVDAAQPPDRGELLRLSVRPTGSPAPWNSNERRGSWTQPTCPLKRAMESEAVARGRHRRRRGGVRRRTFGRRYRSVPRRTVPRPAWLDCPKSQESREIRSPVGRATRFCRRPVPPRIRRRSLFAVQRRGAEYGCPCSGLRVPRRGELAGW